MTAVINIFPNKCNNLGKRILCCGLLLKGIAENRQCIIKMNCIVVIHQKKKFD